MPVKNDTAVILLSRQHLRPSLKDEWVQSLKKAVEFVKRKGWTLCSSVGTPNWEIITACAAIKRVPLKLFIASNSGQSVKVLASYFNLDQAAVQFINVSRDNGLSTPEAHWKNRDRAVVSAADVLIPVSIKPRGFLSELVSAAKGAGKNVNNDFQVRYAEAAAKISYNMDEACLSNEIKSIGHEYVIHWTRSSNGPWPNENPLDYFRSVLSSLEYPRNALNTLQRIISTKQIIASSKNMPDKVPTVSFSGLAPTATIKLMRWRPRYRQMSFEPYGLGIEINQALSMGIKEVQYYNPKTDKIPKSVPSWLTQSIGRITDWRHEEEFRHKGDFDFAAVPQDRLLAVCHYQAEALVLKQQFGLKSVSFCD